MRSFSPLLLLSSLLLLYLPTSSLASFASRPRPASNDAASVTTYGGQRIVPGKFLIEVDNGSSEGGEEGRRRVKRAGGAVALLDSVLTLLASPPSSSSSSSSSPVNPSNPLLPFTLTPLRTFASNPDVFTGAVVSLSEDEIAAAGGGGGGALTGEEVVREVLRGLKGMEGVKRAWPLRLIPAPSPVLREGLPPSTGSLPSSRLTRRATSTSDPTSPSSYLNDTFGPHAMAGVDVAHSKGVLGQGVKVGVIDTGVDYLNPILGGGFGPSFPISFGRSFVSSSSSPSDPYTSCTSHGTHVSGILSARPNALGFTGVAPLATVGHYRIFDCEDSTSEDNVVAALLAAAEDGCDVISLSLGSNQGWLGASPSQIVAERLESMEGRVVVVSAGNDRAEGLFFANSPAATTGGISVGSVDVLTLPAYPLTVIAPRLTLPYLSPSPLDLSALSPSLPSSGLSLYFTSTTSNTADDACGGALPDSTPDLGRRVTVIRRGTCTFTEKLTAAAAKGAKIVLIYDSPASDNTIPYLDVSLAPNSGLVAVASLRYQEGQQLLDLYNARPRGVFVTFPTAAQGAGLVDGVRDTIGGGVVSYFSEYGPTFELVGQPSLTAPGGNILSTFPVGMGGVGVISGTSMACPFVSGSVALLLSAKRDLKLTPLEVRAILATTAKRTTTTVGGSAVESVLLQGGGLVQIDKALSTGTILTPFSLPLNDTAFFASVQILTLRNTNSYAMTYSLSASTAQGLTTYSSSAAASVLPATSPPSIPSTSARVVFSLRTITVPAGQTATVTATFTAPRLAQSQIAKFPFYSGYVEVTGRPVYSPGKAVEVLSVPYFGLAAKMSDLPVLDTTATVYGDIKYPFVATGENYQTAPASSYPFSSGFSVYFRLAGGTRLLTIDLILANTSFTPTIPMNRVVDTVEVDSSDSPSSRFSRLRKRDSLASGLSTSSSSSASSLLSYLTLNISTPLLPASLAASASSTRRKYSDTPLVGNLLTSTLIARDYLVDGGGSTPYTESVAQFVPSEAVFAAGLERGRGAGGYRVLIRALKTTADPAYEDSYESYLSYPITFTT